MDHNPIQCIRKIIELTKSGKFMSLDMAREIGHLWCWLVDVLSTPDDVLKAETDEELINALWDLVAVLDIECESEQETFKGVIGPAVMIMLIELVIKWLARNMENGELARMIQQAFDEWKKDKVN